MKIRNNSYYEPLMELIVTKNYNAIWNSTIIQEITYNVGKKIHYNLITKTTNDGIFYTVEDVYADMYFVLAKCVDTYSPYNKNGTFINFKTFYINSLSYLKNYILKNSSLFLGESYIKTNEGFQKREFLLKGTDDTEEDEKKKNIFTIGLTDKLDTSSIEEREINEQLIKLISSIEHIKTRKVLLMLLEGKNQYEIAPILGVTQAQVNKIIRNVGDLKFVALTKSDIKIIEDIFKLFDKDVYELSAKRKKRRNKRKTTS